MRTIDDIPYSKNQFIKSRGHDGDMEERQRIFEDEIIKRIRTLQDFVKGFDKKFKTSMEKQRI
jgi:hypothetical protein